MLSKGKTSFPGMPQHPCPFTNESLPGVVAALKGSSCAVRSSFPVASQQEQLGVSIIRGTMEAANCSLKLNRLLLDPKFESYKLSLDPLPCYNVELDAAVAEVKLRDDQYTLDHMRAFGMYNYLHCDSWFQDNMFYVDQLGKVMNVTVPLV
ncbi:hypothetical protein FKM82_026765, partial [Ascaphus truei]